MRKFEAILTLVDAIMMGTVRFRRTWHEFEGNKVSVRNGDKILVVVDSVIYLETLA